MRKRESLSNNDKTHRLINSNVIMVVLVAQFWGPPVDEWPDAPRGTVHDVRNLNEKVRSEILKVYQS